MKDLKEYNIQFVGLKLGDHVYEYEIENKFFESFNFDEFHSSNIKVVLNFSKKSNLFELCFQISGSVNLDCDVSLESYDQTVEGKFSENTAYDPRSPYSASKASSDHLVRAYYHTYGLPILISNCSNNYGPSQHLEKFIPLMIKNIINNKPLPIYGKGDNIRDWIYVEDHAEAIDLILHKGKVGSGYNIGGDNEHKNIAIVYKLIELTDRILGRSEGASEKLISFVPDRLGHDFRYAINSTKIKNELGWTPKTSFDEGLKKTIKYYIKKLS